MLVLGSPKKISSSHLSIRIWNAYREALSGFYHLYHLDSISFYSRLHPWRGFWKWGKCQGPAPVDPGNSKRGQRWRGKTYLFINIRLDQETIVYSRKIKWRKKAEELGLRGRPIKFQTRSLHHLRWATGAHLNIGGAPPWGPPHVDLKSRDK